MLTLLPLLCQSSYAGVSTEYRQLSRKDSPALLEKGYNHIVHREFKKALICYKVVADRYDDNFGNKQKAKYAVVAMENIGSLYLITFYDYKKAMEYLLKAKDLAEKYHLNTELGYIHLSLATINHMNETVHERTDTSVKSYLKKAFECGIKQNDYNLSLASLFNMFEISIEQRDANYSLGAQRQFKKQLLNKGQHLYDYALLGCKGMEAYLHNNCRKAAQYFVEAAKKTENDPDAGSYKLNALSCGADIYAQTGAYQEAEVLYLKALELAKTQQAQDYLLEIYGKLYHIYQKEKKGKLEQQYDFLFLKLKDSLLEKAQLTNVKDLKFDYELKKSAEELRSLSEKRRTESIYLFMAICIIFISSLLLYRLSRAYQRIRLSNQVIYKNNVDLLKREAEARKEHEKANETIARLKQQIAKPKQPTASGSSSDTKALYEKVVDVFEHNVEIYQRDFNATRLAELVDALPRYVSAAISKEHGSNFNSLLNEYRLKEACRRLNDQEHYGDFTIEAIAESVGFKSRTGFARLFKEFTGLTPSVYLRMARER